MRGGTIIHILQKLSEAAIVAADVVDVLMGSSRGASLVKLERRVIKRARDRELRSARESNRQKARQYYYNILSRLKRDGLIQKNNEKCGVCLRITEKGKQRLSLLKIRSKQHLPTTEYPREDGVRFVIVTFDIPERERRKRDWLRTVLKNLGLMMIQKSVWLGKIKIPQTLIDDLANLRIAECVEIFEITKAGSLKQVS